MGGVVSEDETVTTEERPKCVACGGPMAWADLAKQAQGWAHDGACKAFVATKPEPVAANHG